VYSVERQDDKLNGFERKRSFGTFVDGLKETIISVQLVFCPKFEGNLYKVRSRSLQTEYENKNILDMQCRYASIF
jgi:hypothetical protein